MEPWKPRSPRAGLLHFLSLADSGASFFSTQYESSLLIDNSCGGTWQREASDGGKLFRGFFFLGATSLLALLAGGCDAPILAKLDTSRA